jgi:hypothetical protein
MTGGAFTEQSRAFLSDTGLPCMDKPLELQRLHTLLSAMVPLEATFLRQRMDTRSVP